MTLLSKFNVTRYEGTLANGIRVVLFHRPAAPIATTAVLKSGSRYDPASMPGVAHFIEHMIVNGSEKFPTKDLLSEHIESIGGSYGARTSQNYMMVDTEVSEAADYGRVTDLFEATLCKPLMDRKMFENEKRVIIKEIQRSDSNPIQVLVKTARKLFFKDTPFEHQIIGDEKSISALEYDAVMAEYKKFLDKSRITFIASGDISFDELLTHLNTLSFLEGNPIEENSEVFVAPTEPLSLGAFFDTPQTQIALGVHGPKLFTKESIHLNLLGNILAQGRASRLTKRLRYEKGLVYGVGLGKYGGFDFGAWCIMTETSTDKVQEVVDEIIKEIQNVRMHGITESELEFVKNRTIKSMKRDMQTSGDWVSFYSVPEVFVKNGYGVDMFVQNIEETTVEDISRVVEAYFTPEKWRLVLCGKGKENIELHWQQYP